MKKRERKAGLARMREYVTTLQPLLMLQHWQIRVSEKRPDNGDHWASCYRVPRQWSAWLYFADDLFGEKPEQQRETVVHELLHIVRAMEYVAVREGYEGLGQTSRAWAWERFDHEQEVTTDHLARILAPYMPLPPVATSGDDDVLAVAVVRFGEE